MIDILGVFFSGAAGEGASGGVFALLRTGGPVVAVLGGMSVIALTIVLAKLWQFRMAGTGDRLAARRGLELWRAGRGIEALALAERSRHPAADALAQAIRGRIRKLPEGAVREEVLRSAADRLEELRGWLRPLEVIASLAPLLGLFGTVLGMIEAFRQLEAAGSQVDPSVLSGGIWEALLTTAVGLAVAIPAVIALNWLERTVERVAHEAESVATAVFTLDLSAGVRLDPGLALDRLAPGAGD